MSPHESFECKVIEEIWASESRPYLTDSWHGSDTALPAYRLSAHAYVQYREDCLLRFGTTGFKRTEHQLVRYWIQFWLVSVVLPCVPVYWIAQVFRVDSLIIGIAPILLLSNVVYFQQACPSPQRFKQQSRAMRMCASERLPLEPQWESFITLSNSRNPPSSPSSLVPSPMLADYLQRREKLIAEDRALRIDHVRANYSAAEIKADKVVRSIRTKEAVSVWGVDHENIPHPYPGMEFLNAKEIIVKTDLFSKIVSKMPKGGLLHLHQNTSVEARAVLDLALGHPAIHIRVPGPLDAASLETVLPKIQPIPVEQYPAADAIGITDLLYTGGWVPINKARELFDPALGGPAGFDKWVLSTFVINPSDAFKTYNTPMKIWLKFGSTFAVTDPIIRFVPIQREYLRMCIRSSIDDGISYIEIRTSFHNKYILAEDAKTKLELRELLLIFREVINEVKAEMKAKGREDDFAGLKIIYNTLRIISVEELEAELDRCSRFKQEFPDLIAGFDLVGHEDGEECKPLIYYAEPLLRFAEQHPDIPFIFHAGETLGDGSAADMNLYDAILLGTKRIGHGFSLAKHPKLMQICREKKIAIEVCPISNEVLRLTSSMPMHPLPIIMNQGIPVVLSSDDPAMFNSMGLSFDFFQVLVASEVTGLLTLGQMARDSITYSMLDERSKRKAMDAWERRWTKFIEEVAAMSP